MTVEQIAAITAIAGIFIIIFKNIKPTHHEKKQIEKQETEQYTDMEYIYALSGMPNQFLQLATYFLARARSPSNRSTTKIIFQTQSSRRQPRLRPPPFGTRATTGRHK